MAPRMRRVGMTLGIIVVSVGLLVGAFVVVARPRPVPWDELQAISDSFPIPAGYHVIDTHRRGRHCWIGPCEHVTLALIVRPDTGQPTDRAALCAAVAKSAEDWAKLGVQLHPARTLGGICDYEATFKGHSIQVNRADRSLGSIPAIVVGVFE